MANWSPNRTDIAAIIISQLIFWIGVFRYVELPGLYHDSVNPDYLVARSLNDQIDNPAGPLFTAWFPLLGNLYHGVQNYYIGLPIFWFFGTNIVAVRIEQALFGAVIVFLLYILSLRVTGNRFVSFLAAVGLASDIAFLASFRSQFYLQLGGEVWLFASLSLLPLANLPVNRFRFGCILSGVCFGLAIYGYFIYLFFLPALLWLIISNWEIDTRQAIKLWICGVAIGLLPYVLGYISMAIRFGGIGATLEWLQSSLTGLKIFSSHQTLLSKFGNAFELFTLALNNVGNESMVFSETLEEGVLAETKIVLMCLALLVGIIFAIVSYKKRDNVSHYIGKQMVFLPLSYFFIAALLGKRLWIQHYTLFIPLMYLICAITVNEVYQLIKPNLAECVAIPAKLSLAFASILLLLFLNIQQQQSFFERLDQTGGVGKASSALTQLAEEALPQQDKYVYFFPEWGFFPSFNLLTGNRIPFEIDLDTPKFDKFAHSKRDIRLLFWNLDDKENYIAVLKSQGIDFRSLRTFYQRDGKPVFYMIEAAYSQPGS